ncbi:MAG: hypothetical protein AAGB34_03695, partial [Planctomycetota bacterium]
SIVFLFGEDATKKQHTELVLPDGSLLPVALSNTGVSWVLLNAHLAGRATLDYCSLSAFAVAGSTFICSGPSGSEGMLSINGSHLDVTVPSGKTPVIEEVEGLAVVVANEEHLDQIQISSDGQVFVGANALNDEEQPISSSKTVTQIAADASVSDVEASSATRSPTTPKLQEWVYATTEDWLDGSSDRYALISGPSSLQTLGVSSGYAWLRIRFKQSATKKTRVSMPFLADRATMFLEGEEVGVLGVGPGAEGFETSKSLRKGELTITALLDSLGRDAIGSMMNEPKGLFGHVYELAAVKGAASLVEDEPIDPLDVRTPVFGLHRGELTDARRLTYEVTHRKKTPLILEIGDLPVVSVVLLNGEAIRVVDPHRPTAVLLDDETTTRGKNTIQIAIMGDAGELEKELKAQTRLVEGVRTISADAQWAFGKWEPPTKGKYKKVDRADLSGTKAKAYAAKPGWWKCAFEAPAGSPGFYVKCEGLSKGQIFVNKHNAGRYFVTTADGKNVGPGDSVYVPASALNDSGKQEIVIFDEQGFTPSKVKISYSA